jgi:peptidoglycan DL-endopeptidase CwlO
MSFGLIVAIACRYDADSDMSAGLLGARQMTLMDTHSTHRTLSRVVRRSAAIAAIASAALVTLVPGGAEAAREPSPVADAAAAALASWDTYERTRDVEDLLTHLTHRDRLAAEVAAQLGVEVDDVTAAWSRADRTKQEAVLAALSQVGVPYRSMASEEGVGFDCSGLTSFAYRRAGVEISRPSRGQINEAVRIDATVAEAGDLVYYPGHVSMSLGIPGAIVHSPNSGDHVEVTWIREGRRVVYGDVLG